MKQKKKIIIILIVLLLFAGIFLRFSVFNNVSVLFLIAEGLDRPSKAYYVVIERIYRLSEKKRVRAEIWEDLESNKNPNLDNLYIQVLGITGAHIPTGSLIKLYSLNQHDMNRRSTVSRIIDAMGLLGNEDFVPFLETLLTDYDKLSPQATRYAITRSLYLITGNRYTYLADSGQKSRLQLTNELIEARNVVENTKERGRNMKDMLVLDRLYRPPGW